MKKPFDPKMGAVMALFPRSFMELGVRLACRWKDEREYEDITEYAGVLRGKLPLGVTLTAMTKRPFGFRFKTDDQRAFQLAFSHTGKVTLDRVDSAKGGAR